MVAERDVLAVGYKKREQVARVGFTAVMGEKA